MSQSEVLKLIALTFGGLATVSIAFSWISVFVLRGRVKKARDEQAAHAHGHPCRY